mmetsp:Transcript_16731/g.25331  ORF Transcript_16731/g.25331 Transcript_16731/m.25331 type:complete len:109 (-) Transcript_16731:694-1020(-)
MQQRTSVALDLDLEKCNCHTQRLASDCPATSEGSEGCCSKMHVRSGPCNSTSLPLCQDQGGAHLQVVVGQSSRVAEEAKVWPPKSHVVGFQSEADVDETSLQVSHCRV